MMCPISNQGSFSITGGRRHQDKSMLNPLFNFIDQMTTMNQLALDHWCHHFDLKQGNFVIVFHAIFPFGLSPLFFKGNTVY
ncbi:hypothetical protein SDC9_72530 [bioreactor metagenome]|uniref:Uncharacterized protein n=1 Tax=bioreactor metagenome TaxID=1076179 RepID=A0A644YCK7_9ZZZZ